MGANSMQCISITRYHSEMGKICFPKGFEEHLKKLVYEYVTRTGFDGHHKHQVK